MKIENVKKALFASQMYDLLKELLEDGDFFMSAIEAGHPSVDFEDYEERLQKLLKDIES